MKCASIINWQKKRNLHSPKKHRVIFPGAERTFLSDLPMNVSRTTKIVFNLGDKLNRHQKSKPWNG